MNHSTVFRKPVSCPLRLSLVVCVFMLEVTHADDAYRYVVINQYSQMMLFNLIGPLADRVAPQGIM